ncbi:MULTISPECIES: N-acetylmuramate alpha-1-phosphate uridylyltransferase MurU [Halomonas]|uniref:N-acetylmuramate alpha-1-phosphate uridylyltransferase MurU n=1 Tax=Halomonas TaxID=2745 RepID=UPI001A8DA744|nr:MULTISPECIES: nucleotidyltransferase family protein [Halomonas]MBN8412318.1 nucleotidyltransferase family protein [Halomonas litopenaei]MBY5929670.1 nucleotidyltransferase family protein [Halomonas sp. DP8Y7-3]MBY5968555.1 nucleotidyltransferase family protein [Halomonas denitrificans]
MKAMILAAGLGKRMRPLTDHCPKPLLPVAGEPLIGHHLKRLAAVGIRDVVINVSYRADQIVEALGDGVDYGVSIAFSHESQPLETAGGIAKARPLLGEAPFLLISADAFCDIDPATLSLAEGDLAHLVMVDNPPHHPQGDFHLTAAGRVQATGAPRLTYSGIALIDPRLVNELPEPCYPVAPLLRQAMASDRVAGTHHHGEWVDVGTPERLEALNQRLSSGHRSSRP